MVNIIHTGDIHLGREFRSYTQLKQYGKTKRSDIKNTLFKIIDIAEKEEVHLLLIAGDLFDEETCSLDELKIVNNKFKLLEKTNIIICSGNHDPLDEGSLYKHVDWSDNVYIFKNFQDIDYIEIPDLNTCVYSASWNTKERNDDILSKIKIEDFSKNNILMLHGDLVTTDSRYLPIDKTKLINKGFDYVALGHIHKPTAITDNIRYCGSPEPLDFGETNEHGIVKVNIDNKVVSTEFLPIAKREYHIAKVCINEEMDTMQIVSNIRNMMTTIGKREDIFKIELIGVRNSRVILDFEECRELLEDICKFVYFLDKTKLDYNVEQIYKDNKNNMIGMFIKEMKSKDLENPIVRDALYVGLDLLLGEKVNEK